MGIYMLALEYARVSTLRSKEYCRISFILFFSVLDDTRLHIYIGLF